MFLFCLFLFSEDVDELDSHLILTCVAVDLICELLTGIRSNNALQQEAVTRWAKLLIGNVTEPVLQVIISFTFFLLIRELLFLYSNMNFV